MSVVNFLSLISSFLLDRSPRSLLASPTRGTRGWQLTWQPRGYPMDFTFHLQSFSAPNYVKTLKSKQQATVAYSFIAITHPLVAQMVSLSTSTTWTLPVTSSSTPCSTRPSRLSSLMKDSGRNFLTNISKLLEVENTDLLLKHLQWLTKLYIEMHWLSQVFQSIQVQSYQLCMFTS